MKKVKLILYFTSGIANDVLLFTSLNSLGEFETFLLAEDLSKVEYYLATQILKDCFFSSAVIQTGIIDSDKLNHCSQIR